MTVSDVTLRRTWKDDEAEDDSKRLFGLFCERCNILWYCKSWFCVAEKYGILCLTRLDDNSGARLCDCQVASSKSVFRVNLLFEAERERILLQQAKEGAFAKTWRIRCDDLEKDLSVQKKLLQRAIEERKDLKTQFDAKEKELQRLRKGGCPAQVPLFENGADDEKMVQWNRKRLAELKQEGDACQQRISAIEAKEDAERKSWRDVEQKKKDSGAERCSEKDSLRHSFKKCTGYHVCVFFKKGKCRYSKSKQTCMFLHL